MGVVTIVGGIQMWSQPEYGQPWRVLTILVGILFLTLAAFLVVSSVYQPRTSISQLRANLEKHEGVFVAGSRRVTIAATVLVAVAMITAAAGAFFAAGAWRLVLVVLLVALACGLAAAVVAVRRPRFLWLRSDSVESSTQRSHAAVKWSAIRTLSLPTSGGGEVVLRIHAAAGEGVATMWSNPLMRSTASVDIDLGSLGLNPDLVAGVITDLTAQRHRRALLETDREAVLARLTDHAAPWPGDTPGQRALD